MALKRQNRRPEVVIHRPVTRSQTRSGTSPHQLLPGLPLKTKKTASTARASRQARAAVSSRLPSIPVDGGRGKPGQEDREEPPATPAASSPAGYDDDTGLVDGDGAKPSGDYKKTLSRKRKVMDEQPDEADTPSKKARDGSGEADKKQLSAPVEAVSKLEIKTEEDDKKTVTTSSALVVRGGVAGALIRRSARLHGKSPAVSFEQYFTLLPTELQWLILEQAARDQFNGRVVIMRNLHRAVPALDSGGALTRYPNSLPSLFTTSVDAHKVIRHFYKQLIQLPRPSTDGQPTDQISELRPYNLHQVFIFPRVMSSLPSVKLSVVLHVQTDTDQASTPGYWFNSDLDILLFEPCCSGCRAYHCACRQLSAEHRAEVRIMAVQTESANLSRSAWPCWRTVSLAWPNVEVLILVLNLDWEKIQQQTTPWALKSTNEGLSRSQELQTRFSEWKNSPDGMRVNLKKLAFANIERRGPKAPHCPKRWALEA